MNDILVNVPRIEYTVGLIEWLRSLASTRALNISTVASAQDCVHIFKMQ